jgi:hypothetical protein
MGSAHKVCVFIIHFHMLNYFPACVRKLPPSGESDLPNLPVVDVGRQRKFHTEILVEQRMSEFASG